MGWSFSPAPSPRPLQSDRQSAAGWWRSSARTTLSAMPSAPSFSIWRREAHMTDAQQPGLRSFIVYDDLPNGCIAFENILRSVGQHVRRGEFVVVDPTDCDPMHGELFLIEWESTRTRQLVEMMRRDRDGSEHCWYAEIGRAVQQECRDRSRMPSSA
eukprot:TRINITY_DN10947_c0_g1_i3.p3 TRINITY_DN10947_c0_g1~~TRINITY_DN10947_c0_g1_i3.p3  ORF type:complete len:157 (+),score=18.97 TRINITY_DN10947_c0_g1_i3:442-912(+)